MRLAFLSIFLLFCISVFSQEFSGKEADSIIDGSSFIKINPDNGLLEYISFEQSFIKSGENHIDVVSKALQLENGYRLKEFKEYKDSRHDKHVKNQLYYNDIPIEGMYFTSHFKNGQLYSANGKTIKGDFGPVRNYIDKREAVEIAIDCFDSKKFVWSDNKTLYPEAELIYLSLDGKLQLCYKVDVYSLIPLQREYVYVSAEDGKVVDRISRINDTDVVGTATTKYSGTVSITTNDTGDGYTLSESNRGLGISTYNLNTSHDYSNAELFTDSDNVWDNPNDDVAYDAHYGSEKTYDYYYNKFGRNSIDDNGFELVSYVHYGYKYANAFWNGESMTYGDGDDINYGAFVTVDVVAHEITHGLTTHTAGLMYRDESGALNESFSDIFGVAVDYYASPSTANFIIGEQVVLNGDPIRNMQNPNSLGDPDTYKGNYWYFGSGDNGGVHTNSSVQNYWFYLLCEGGDGVNDLGNAYRVNSIGMSSAEAIAYRTLTVYLTPYSDYAAARFYSIRSAIDLYGECSPEVTEVTNAWYAVGVGEPFDNSVQAGFRALQRYSCEVPVNISFDNYSQNASSFEWLINGSIVSNDTILNYRFDSAGTYSVGLIATGHVGCSGIDTVIFDDYITVANNLKPVDPNSTPESIYGGNGGPWKFQIGEFQHYSANASVGYEDFSCINRIDVTEGLRYPVNILTGSDEDVYIWLDSNQDGNFDDDSELLWVSRNNWSHSTELYIPAISNNDQPLRLRIGTERGNYRNLVNGSSVTYYGQYEDYTIFIADNTNPPEADFIFSKGNISINETVDIVDNSINSPDSWSWSFEGGTPSASTVKDPQVSFSELGFHDVQLIVENSYGSDTLTKAIEVVDEYIIGTDPGSTNSGGKLYDSGGRKGSYSSNEDFLFLIEPTCSKAINIVIDEVYTESCCDALYIYDGASTSDPLLGEYRGSHSTAQFINTTSKQVLIRFKSDGSVNSNGFALSWSSDEFGDGNNVEANFVLPTSPIPLNYLFTFEDQSNYEPFRWDWDFGNGTYGNEQNPQVEYTSPGDYEVSLVVENCTSIDTTQHTIVVDAAPNMNLLTDTIVYNLVSGDTIRNHIQINNGIGGSLVFSGKLLNVDQNSLVKEVTERAYITAELNQLSHDETPEVISTTLKSFQVSSELTGVDIGIVGYDPVVFYSSLISECKAKGAQVSSINWDNYKIALDTINVLIIDDGSQWIDNDVESFKDWIRGGGLLIINGDNNLNTFSSLLSETGLILSPNYSNYGSASVISHYVTEGVNNYQINSSSLCSMSASGNAKGLILDSDHKVFAAVEEFGNGKVFMACDEIFTDYLYNDPNNKQLFTNLLNWGSLTQLGWITVEEEEQWLSSESSGGVNYFVNSEGLLEGTYYADIQIISNDAAADQTIVPIKLNVTGIEDILVYGDAAFDKVFVNHVDSILLGIRNQGTRELKVDSFMVSHPDFIIDQDPVIIKPDQNLSIPVVFQPSASKIYRDTITVYSSDPDSAQYKYPVYGNAVFPPIINTVDTVRTHLYSDEIFETDLLIENIGGSSMSIDSIYIGSFSTENGIIADSSHVDLTGYDIFLWDGYNSSYLQNRLIEYGATAQYGYLDTANVNSDIIYITGEMSFYDYHIEFLKNWMNNGKSIFIDISYYDPELIDFINEMGIGLIDTYTFSGVTKDLAIHPTTYGLDEYIVPQAYYAFSISGEAQSLIKDIRGNIVTACVEYGEGRFVVSNSNTLRYANNHQWKFGVNSFRWLAQKNSWLWVSHYPIDSIEVNESHAMKLQFNAQGLMSGTYRSKLKIDSNDPVNSPHFVNTELSVTGIARSQFMSDSLNFDLVYKGAEKVLQASIFNVGTETLEIHNILTEGNYFACDTNNLVIEPKESALIDISYSPDEVGSDETFLIIETNARIDRDTLVLSGYCQEPPVLSLSPKNIDLTLRTQDKATETITIDNSTGGSRLDYEVIITYPDQNYADNNDLEVVMDSLATHNSRVRNVIPNKYNFYGGESGYYISDGGGDMYDGGNWLNTERYSSIPYSNNNIIKGGAFGDNGSYFTAKYDGLFVLVADLDNINSFYTSGNLGADGRGIADGSVLEMEINGVLYKGFVKRVYNSGDVSVNHLIIVEDNGAVSHSFDTNTNYDAHIIENLSGVKRLHYLLFGGNNSSYINDDSMYSIMEEYLNVAQLNTGWVIPQNQTGWIEAGQSSNIDLLVDPGTLDDGNYTALVEVNSNDPVKVSDTTIVNLHVFNNLPPYLRTPVGNKVLYTTYDGTIELDSVFSDPDNDRLYYTVTSSDNSIVFPVVNNRSQLMLLPQAEGVADIEISCTDNNWDPVYDNFTVLVKQNHKPYVSQNISNQELVLQSDNSDYLIDFDSYFEDEDGDQLSYSITLANDINAVNYSLGGNLCIFSANKVGTAIVTVKADDGNSGLTTQSFTIRVKSIATSLTENKETKVEVFPNPVSDELCITVRDQQPVNKVVLVSSTGIIRQLGTEFNNGVIKINTSDLASGVYMVQIHFDDEHIVKRIVKQ